MLIPLSQLNVIYHNTAYFISIKVQSVSQLAVAGWLKTPLLLGRLQERKGRLLEPAVIPKV